jgi:hypothetical protein
VGTLRAVLCFKKAKTRSGCKLKRANAHETLNSITPMSLNNVDTLGVGSSALRKFRHVIPGGPGEMPLLVGRYGLFGAIGWRMSP